MESFSVRTTLNEADWRALMTAAGLRLTAARQGKKDLLARSAPVVLWVALVGAIVVLFTSEPPLVRPLGLFIMCGLFFGTWWVQYYLQRRLYTPDDRGAFLGPHEFVFETRGFHSRRSNSEAFNRWSLAREITHSDDHVFLWIDAFSGYVIPARDLPDAMTAPAAVSRLRELMATAPVEPDAEPAMETPLIQSADSALAPERARAPLPTTIAQELTALLRLHTWALVDGARLYGRDVTLLLLGVFSFAWWAGLDRLDYEGEVEVFWYTFSDTGVLALALLLTGLVLSRISKPRVELRRALLLVLAFLPIFVLGLWLAMKLPSAGTIVIMVFVMAWADRYLVAGMRSLTGKPQHLAVTATLAITFALFYLSTKFYFSPTIWYQPEADPEQTAAMRQENEQLIFEQSSRLSAAIEGLTPRDATKTNAFFVGFAGYGAQRVFAEEIGLAAKRIEARYGTVGRSLRLINDRRDHDSFPIATVPALRQALKAIATRMNLEEDVLFLALSSHGSENATISVSNDVGYWRDLNASELADMLRESGIRWKVIVISACHSGSFIDALRDENTIVLTAAAADRSSFGCSDDNDLTYFGEAFYRDALPKAATLREAFDDARETIGRREISEARKPSDPQAHFGAALEKKLAAIESARPSK